jgi:hypothetical protein
MRARFIRVVILSREDGEEPVLSLSKESLTISARWADGNSQRCFAPLNMTQ